jgi:hypothetical protein
MGTSRQADHDSCLGASMDMQGVAKQGVLKREATPSRSLPLLIREAHEMYRQARLC